MSLQLKYLEGVINTVVLGDALEVLRQLPDDCVDAVVTDPPFGIGFAYTEAEEHSEPQEYWKWLAPIYQEMNRITKPGGFVAIWQAQKYYRYFWDWFGDDIHIYAACKNFVQLRSKTNINYGYDPVVIRYKDGAKYLRPSNPKRNVDFFVSKSHKYLLDTKAIEKNHPCPRPLDVVVEILNNFVIEDGLVIDPFIGSGTTGVACYNTGRKYIGIEKNAIYHALATERMSLQNIENLIKSLNDEADDD